MTADLGSLARRLSLPYYEAALPAHDQFHANRVRRLAIRLSDESENSIDEGVLSAAAWFHDVGRPLERTGKIDDHDEWAASEATELLESEGVATDRIDAIEHCIRAHSIRRSSPEPETFEAKLLFDADKLDATGAVGLVRMACIVGERSGRTGEKYAVIGDSSVPGVETADVPDVAVLRNWARERLDALYTSPAQRLGESRWQFVNEFLDRFARETGLDSGGECEFER
jgi:uncharacterized protein